MKQALNHASQESGYDEQRWTLKFRHENILTKFNRLRPDKKLTQDTHNNGIMKTIKLEEKEKKPRELDSEGDEESDNPWIEALKKLGQILEAI